MSVERVSTSCHVKAFIWIHFGSQKSTWLHLTAQRIINTSDYIDSSFYNLTFFLRFGHDKLKYADGLVHFNEFSVHMTTNYGCGMIWVYDWGVSWSGVCSERQTGERQGDRALQPCLIALLQATSTPPVPGHLAWHSGSVAPDTSWQSTTDWP